MLGQTLSLSWAADKPHDFQTHLICHSQTSKLADTFLTTLNASSAICTVFLFLLGFLGNVGFTVQSGAAWAGSSAGSET